MSVFKVVFFGFGLLLTVVGVAGAVVKLLPADEAPVSPEPSFEVDEQGTVLLPKAVVEGELEHDFGFMKPDSMKSYQFHIRNDGEGLLELSVGTKTCGCVGAKITPVVVKPGERALVEVEWESREWDSTEYRQGFRIRTNDPENREFKFRAFGELKYDLRADPAMLYYARVMPGESQWQQTEIYTQVWDSFSLEDVHTTIEGAEWNIIPFTAEQMIERRAKCGYVIQVKVPSTLPVGQFDEFIKFRVVSDDIPSGERDERIAVTGKVIRRLSAYGDNLDIFQAGQERFYFGMLHPGSGAKTSVRLFVRDEIKDLNLQQIEVEPSFVKVRVTEPEGTAAKKAGLYVLEVEIPEDSRGNFLGQDAGFVHLKFNHPRIDDFRVGLEFAVLDTN